jgi:hypothetical protein
VKEGVMTHATRRERGRRREDKEGRREGEERTRKGGGRKTDQPSTW